MNHIKSYPSLQYDKNSYEEQIKESNEYQLSQTNNDLMHKSFR